MAAPILWREPYEWEHRDLRYWPKVGRQRMDEEEDDFPKIGWREKDLEDEEKR